MSASATENDEKWMREAVLEGEKGRYICAPNPWVGVVIVHDESQELMGRGHHKGPHTPHGELAAV